MTHEELDRYDRQIRAWGFETQQRLHSCHFLFLGVNRTSLECMKNLILAGAGSVSVAGHDENVSEFGEDLKFLSELNPHCPMRVIPLNEIINVNKCFIMSEIVESYDFICLFNADEEVIRQIILCTKTLLVCFNAVAEIIYLRPNFDCQQMKNKEAGRKKLQPIEETVVGALVSQMIVDYLPPHDQSMQYEMVFDPVKLSASVNVGNVLDQ